MRGMRCCLPRWSDGRGGGLGGWVLRLGCRSCSISGRVNEVDSEIKWKFKENVFYHCQWAGCGLTRQNQYFSIGTQIKWNPEDSNTQHTQANRYVVKFNVLMKLEQSSNVYAGLE